MINQTLYHWMQNILAFAGVIAAALLVWAVLSPLIFGLKLAIEKAGFPRFFRYRRMLKLRKLLSWPMSAFGAVRQRVGAFQDSQSVRVAIDERLTRMRDAMLACEGAVELACQKITHFGSGGPAALKADIDELEKRTIEAASLGGDIDENIGEKYRKRATTTVNVVFGSALLLLFAIGNGAFLNQFMQNLITNYIFDIPLSLLVSMLLIVFEAGAGWFTAVWISKSDTKNRLPMILAGALAILVFCFIESAVVGLMSYNFDIDLPLLNDHPNLRFWLAPMGGVFALLTACVSITVHTLMDERAETSGALRLKREIKAANAYVRDLPHRWEKISARAREAKAALDGYSAALGARDGLAAENGAMSGLVRKIADEKNELIRAIADARVDDWAQIVEGMPADNRRETVRNIGLLFLTICAATAAILVFSWFFTMALGQAAVLPAHGGSAAAVLLACSIYAVGFMCFGRLHNVDPRSGRTFPYRTGVAELSAAVFFAVVGAIAILWAGYRAFGGVGILVGLMLIAGSGGLAWLGYHFERSCRGLVILFSLLACAITLAAVACASFAVLSLGWSLAGLFWCVWALLTFLALPTTFVIDLWKFIRNAGRSRPLAATPETGPQLASS